MEKPRVCTQMPCPPELRAQADMLAVQENPLNGQPVTNGNRIKGDDFEMFLSLPINRLWRNGRTLRVKILNGSDKVKSKIRQYASVWNEFSNVKFTFVDSGDAEIRVNVDASNSSWSRIGTGSLPIGDNPTMNFGWLTDSTDEEEFSRVILHEFGHALGCTHEHESPINGISWNKPAVYAYYESTHRWDKDTVDTNIFQVSEYSTTQFSEFDRDSIMIYPIDASHTTNGFSVGWNRKLSKTDKNFIGNAYPPESPDLAYFNTMELRQFDQPAMRAVKRKIFPIPYKSPPLLAVGLNILDIASNANIRVRAFADKITTSEADLHIDTWLDSTLYVGACMWFRAAADDPDFEIGRYSPQDNGLGPTQGKTPCPIYFKRNYRAPPQVVVWLNYLDMAHDKNWRITASATNITNSGFTLNLDSWSDTFIWAVGASWIAYPANKPGVTSGTCSTLNRRGWYPAQASTSGKVYFPSGTFQKIPTVLFALNSLDVPCGNNLRLKASVSSLTKDGMDWNIESWAGSLNHSAGASYIAFDPERYR